MFNAIEPHTILLYSGKLVHRPYGIGCVHVTWVGDGLGARPYKMRPLGFPAPTGRVAECTSVIVIVILAARPVCRCLIKAARSALTSLPLRLRV